MTQGTIELLEQLPARASSVARARALVRSVLERGHAEVLCDDAQLAVSEVITNALVHAGTLVQLRVSLDHDRLHVEVSDGSANFPASREHTTLAGTGRGLTLLDDAVDGWGVYADGEGKVVWFDIRTPEASSADRGAPADRRGRPVAAPPTVAVELRNVPLLMHAAWQEHAAALLRDFLLVRLDEDPLALERHAQASDALLMLHEQLPAPELADAPEAIMATATEPTVSLTAATLTVPRASVTHFATLDTLLGEAVGAADRGLLLVPATQPEVQEMRRWLCREVRGQSEDGSDPVPWEARTDIWRATDVSDLAGWDPAEVTSSPARLLATDESSVIVAVSPGALELLGYPDESALVGRRVITIVPARYRQAHLAGTTLHVVNGRSPLLGVPVTVPVLRADGTERTVVLVIERRRRADGPALYVAELDAPAD